MDGTGSKRGVSVTLEGDYVFRAKVAAKPGCHFQVYVDGLGVEPFDDSQTASSGTYDTTSDEPGIELGSYSLRVVATKCGRWTVSLARS